MPVLIAPVGGGVVFGPGTKLNLQSDFIGPLPSGTKFVIDVGATGSEGIQAIHQVVPTQLPFTSTILADPAAQGLILGPATYEDGRPITVSAVLRDPSDVAIDGGSQTGTWNNTRGLQVFLPEYTEGGGGTGLTPIQAQQLDETHASTFPTELVDELTLTELTSGPSGGFVDAALPNAIFGVIVRIATVPPDLHVGTPDGNYWTRTLAVVRIYRGSDLWMRVPIHTSSKIVPLFGDVITAAVTTLTRTVWIIDMSVQVSFLEGVTGRVYLMRFP